MGQIKGKDKTIKVEEPDYTWTINGKDILTVPEGNISLKITPNPEGFSDTGVDAFFGDTELLKFNIEHSGEFGFTAVLDYKLGQQYADKFANLFYVVGDGTFEYMGHAVVTEEGVGTFRFSHSSDYILAILEEEYTGQPLTTPEPEVTEAPKEPAAEETAPAQSEAPAVTEELPKEDTIIKEEKNPQEPTEVIETIGAMEESNPTWYVVGGVAALAILVVAVSVVVANVKKKK